MEDFFTEIFAGKRPDPPRLSAYGFSANDGTYVYKVDIMQGTFALSVRINGANVDTSLTDKATGDAYVLYKTDAEGKFVGEVRKAVAAVLRDVAEHCFYSSVYKNELTEKLLYHIEKKYGDKPEFLWEAYPDYCVFRRPDNKKWYAVLMNVKGSRLGLKEEAPVEIVDLRGEPEDTESYVKSGKYLPGWHMNKKHWFTVRLDGAHGEDEVFALVDASRDIAGRR